MFVLILYARKPVYMLHKYIEITPSKHKLKPTHLRSNDNNKQLETSDRRMIFLYTVSLGIYSYSIEDFFL